MSPPHCETIEIRKEVETVTYIASSQGPPANPACQVSEAPSSTTKEAYEVHCTSCEWKLVSLTPRSTESTDLDNFLSARGIRVGDVPFIGLNERRKSYDLVVRPAFLDSLVAKLPEFVIKRRYNPTSPTAGDVRVYGAVNALQRARADFVNNATIAAKKSWGQGPSWCYRNIAKANGLTARLQRSILNYDVLRADPTIQEKFARNCLFFCLNGVESLSSSVASELLQRDVNDWLHLILPYPEGLPDDSQKRTSPRVSPHERARLRLEQDRSELQTTSLLRLLFEYSGGESMPQQHRFEMGDRDFTIGQNARLCGSAFGVDWSKPFGQFDPKAMQLALSRSVLFTPSEDSASVIPDTVGWSHGMMRAVPVGFPEGHLALPLQILNDDFGVQQLEYATVYMEVLYLNHPELRTSDNNLLVLLTWHQRLDDRASRVLCAWAQSGIGLHFFRQLKQNFRNRQKPTQLALTVIALLSFEQLLDNPLSGSVPPVESSYPEDLHTLIQGQEQASKRVALAFLRALWKAGCNRLAEIYEVVLDTDQPLLDHLDWLLDRYVGKRLHDGSGHQDAFHEVIRGYKSREQAYLRGLPASRS